MEVKTPRKLFRLDTVSTQVLHKISIRLKRFKIDQTHILISHSYPLVMYEILHIVYKNNNNSNSKASTNNTSKLPELRITTTKVNKDNSNLINTHTINSQLVLDSVLDHS